MLVNNITNRIAISRSVLTILFLIALSGSIFSQATYTSTGNGAWNTSGTWSIGGTADSDGDGKPDSNDNVIIASGDAVTIDIAASCNNLSIGDAGTNSNTSLTINSTKSLHAYGNLSLDPNNGNRTYALNINAESCIIDGSVTTLGNSGTKNLNVTSGTLEFTKSTLTWSSDCDINLSGAGTVTIDGNFTSTAATSTGFKNTSTGTFYFKGTATLGTGFSLTMTGGGVATFDGATSLTTSGTISNSGTAGTINFNSTFTYNSGTFTSMSGENINFASNLTAGTTLTFNAASNAVFSSGSPTITPTAAITFGNLTLATNTTLADDISVANNLTINGNPTITNGGNTIFMTGNAGVISGNSTITIPLLEVSDNANSTLSSDATITTLNIRGTANNTDLTIASGKTLTATTANIYQPTTNTRTSDLKVATGTANIGTLNMVTTTTTASRIVQISVTTGTLTITNTPSFTSNTSAACQVITVTGAAGTINFTAPFTMASGTLTASSTSTINFNGTASTSLVFGGANAPALNCGSGSTFVFAKGFTNNTNALTTLTINVASIQVFNGTGTITPTAAITFGIWKLATGVTTLAGDITVAGDIYTNTGGSVVSSGGTRTIYMTGTANQIATSTSTAGSFAAIVEISDNGGITMNNDNTITTVNVKGTANNTDLTIANGKTLTATTANIYQPTTVSRTSDLKVATGTANIGTLNIIAASATASRIAQVSVTTGTLTITNAPSFTNNNSPASQVITVTGAGGTINFSAPFTMSSGTIAASSTSIVNFNGTASTSLVFGGATVPVLSCGAGSTFTFAAGFTNTNNALTTLNATSIQIFNGTGTITPTAAITFGIFKLATGVTTLAGDITVASDIYTNTGGSLVSAVGTKTIYMTGTANQITTSTSTAGSFGSVIELSDAAIITMNNDNTVTTINVRGTANNTNLTIANGKTLTATTANIYQPTTNGKTGDLKVATGTANIGTLNIVTTNTTISRIAQISVTTGTLTITNAPSFTSNTSAACQVITVTGAAGAINFTAPFTMASGTITASSTSTVNFNGTASTSLVFGGANAPALNCGSGSTFVFAKGFTNNTTALTTLNAASIQIFNGTGTITPTAAITFGIFKLATGVTTLAGDITVAGDIYTNTGGSLVSSGGTRTIYMTGTANQITTSTSTAGSFAAIMEISDNAGITMNNDNTITTVNVRGTGNNTDLTIANGKILTATTTNIYQPTTNGRTSDLKVATGTANIGTLNIVTTNTTGSRIAQVTVTTGVLTVTNAPTFTNNSTAACQVISVSGAGGIISFSAPFTMASGTMTASSTSTINFNGTASTSFVFGGANNPILNCGSGSTFTFAKGFTNNTTALTTLNAASNQTFTATGTITPTAAITFGNLTINSGTVDISNDIIVAGSWSNSGTFTHNNHKITFNGGTAQTITKASGETFYDLTISNSSGNVTLSSGNVTVAATLAFTSGKLVLGANNLTISSGNAISGATSSLYVVTNSTGYLQINSLTASRVFYIGSSTTSYTPLTLVNAGTSDNFNVRVFDEVYSSGTSGTTFTADIVRKTWMIDESVVGGSNATMTAQWNGSDEFATFDRTSCGISHYNTSTGVWDTPTYAAAAGANPYTVSRSGITSFSPYAVEESTHPLPIELLSFTADKNSTNEIELKWTSAKETNNDFYTIEKSKDGIYFEKTNTVKGAGTVTTSTHYNVVDNNPYEGINYYRLSQTDFDGTTKYFNIVFVSIDKNRFEFSLFPNPNDGEKISLNFPNVVQTTGEISIVIVNMNGEKVYVKNISIEEIDGTGIVLNIEQLLSSGLYIVTAANNNSYYQQKLIIK